jgi:hypothetical protein
VVNLLFAVKNITNVMFFHEKASKTASPCSIGAEDAMKKIRKRRQKWATTFREDLGKLLLDIGRLVNGSLVLGILLRGEIPDDILLTVGVAIAAVLYALGLFLGKREIKTEKPEVYRRKRRKR